MEEYNIRFTSKNITEVGNKHLYEYFIITHITHKARKYHRNKKDTQHRDNKSNRLRPFQLERWR